MSYTLTIKKTEMDYIERLFEKRPWDTINQINGIPLSERQIRRDQQAILESYFTANPEDTEVTLTCSSRDPASALPPLNVVDLLTMAGITSQEAWKQQFQRVEPLLRKIARPFWEELYITDDAGRLDPKITQEEGISLQEAFFILDCLRRIPELRLNNAVHLEQYQVIILHARPQGMVLLHYGKPFTCQSLRYTTVFDIVGGEQVEVLEEPILAVLNGFYEEWKSNDFQGPLIPCEKSGFNCFLPKPLAPFMFIKRPPAPSYHYPNTSGKIFWDLGIIDGELEVCKEKDNQRTRSWREIRTEIRRLNNTSGFCGFFDGRGKAKRIREALEVARMDPRYANNKDLSQHPLVFEALSEHRISICSLFGMKSASLTRVEAAMRDFNAATPV